MAGNPLLKGLAPMHPGEFLREVTIPALDLGAAGAPANLFHPISLVGIRPECASSGLWQPVKKQTLAGS
jgi:hypothetical protein